MTKKDDEVKAVPLAKTFDSFDATLRLAAMTDQTEDFREYITQTQKMRAYKGKIESTSPLAAQAAREAAAPVEKKPAPPPPEIKKKPAPSPIAASPMPPPMDGHTTNLIAVAAIVVLAIAAVALMIALVVK